MSENIVSLILGFLSISPLLAKKQFATEFADLVTILQGEYDFLSFGSDDVNSIVSGHNGIRNKIANNWNIANMNLLHWDRDLAIICKDNINNEISKDTKNLSTGYNSIFSTLPTGSRWTGRVIRRWYLEIGFDIENFNDLTKATPSRLLKMSNFIQMIWPSTEYIGCSAARTLNGFLMGCCYSPKALMSNFGAFTSGEACTKCSEERPTCSRHFTSLCGLDLRQRNKMERSYQISSFLMLWNLVFHFIFYVMFN